MHLYSQLLGRVKPENCTTALQPGQQGKIPSQKQTKSLFEKCIRCTQQQIRDGRRNKFNKNYPGQVWWLTPVILALWEAEVADPLRSGV